MATTITTLTALQNMENDLTEDYVLGANIDASDTSTWNGNAGFVPIGQSSPYFTGTFDSAGYTISDLFIDRPTEDYIGLFGVINGATITDCALIDVDMTGDDDVGGCVGFAYGSSTITGSYTTGDVKGNDVSAHTEVGGFAGTIDTCTVTSCYSTATVASGTYGSGVGGFVGYDNANTVTSCYATGAVSGAEYLGGFAGKVNGGSTFTKCYATGSVTGTGQSVGGFSGGAPTTGSIFSKCYATGNVITTGNDYAGGFGGDLNAAFTISNCYAMGDVTASSAQYVGGFGGDITSSTITYCYSKGAVDGNTDVGGFCGDDSGAGATVTGCFWDTETSGQASSDAGTGKTTVQMKLSGTYTNWDFTTIWNLNAAFNDGYPALRWSDVCDSDSETREKTIGPVYDPQGRIPKGARAEARRADTGVVAETEYLDSNGKATFTELPNDTDVTFWVTWGGTIQALKTDQLHSTIIGVSEGGTGASDVYNARSNLGLGREDSPTFAGLTTGADGDGGDVKLYGGTASNSLLWDASENVLDITSTMKAADNVVALVVTDATTLSSGYGRAAYISYTVSGTKTGSYAINGLGIDMTVSEACPTVAGMEVYLAAISNKTVSNIYPLSIYCEDIGTAVSNFMGLDIGINSTNLAASRHTGMRIRNHSGTAKAAIMIEEAFTDTILRHSPSGVDLNLITLDNSSGAKFYWDDSEQKFRFNKGLYLDEAPTFTTALELGHTDVYSNDYGLNWADLGVIATDNVGVMVYLGNGIVVLADEAGYIFRSVDYGATWTSLGDITGTDNYAIAYLGNGIVIIGDATNHVWRSTDYGLNWSDLGTITADEIHTMCYLGNGIAILGDDDFKIFRSTDYGASWSDIGVVATNRLQCSVYLGDGIVIAGSVDYHVYRSTDYGVNWSDLGAVGDSQIISMAYLGSGIALIGTQDGDVYRSTDYGANWTSLGDITGTYTYTISNLGNGIVLMGDANYHIWRSKDYGLNWTDLGTITGDIIRSLVYLGNGIVLCGDNDYKVWRSTSAFQVWDEGLRYATDVNITELSTATYDDVQDFINQFGNRTHISGMVISDALDGTCNISAGTGWCKVTNDLNAAGVFFDFAGGATDDVGTHALTNLAVNYIYLDYNGGTPQIIHDDTGALFYTFDHIVLGCAYRHGTHCHLINSNYAGLDAAHQTKMRAYEAFGAGNRTSGLVTTSTGTRNLAISAGVIWTGLTRTVTLSFNTSSVTSSTATAGTTGTTLVDSGAPFTANDVGKTVKNTTSGNEYTHVIAYVSTTTLTLEDAILENGENYQIYDSWNYWYYDGDAGPAAWVNVEHSTQISRTQYNAVATGLASLTSNRYGVHWVYLDAEGKHLHVVYGQGNYLASQAENAGVPASLPPVVTSFSSIIAKIICQEGTDTLTISYPWTTAFTTSLATDHNALANLATGDVHTQYFLVAGETTNAQLHSGADLIVYSDAGSTEKARIDGATGNISTLGTIELGHASDTTIARPAAGQLTVEGSSVVIGPGPAPNSSTDNGIVRWHGSTGNIVQGYTSNPPTISDTGDINIDGDLDVENIVMSGTIELGHASDTTVARSAAGRATIESVNLVRGPSSATDNAIARYSGTTGDLIQEYTSNAPTISDTGDITVDGDVTADNIITAGDVDGVDVSVHDPATTGVHGAGSDHVALFPAASTVVNRIVWKATNSADVSDTNRTATLEWTDLDLTSATSANAKGVFVRAHITVDTVGTGQYCYLAIRKNGDTPTYGPMTLADKGGSEAGTVSTSGIFMCECDSSQVIEYKINIATDWQIDSYLIVLGYWE